MKNLVLIFAGGVGSRMGNTEKPKQFMEVDEKAILIHTLEKFEDNLNVDGIVVSILPEYLDYTKDLINQYSLKKVKWVVPGGETGQLSIFNGLEAIALDKTVSEDAIVLIHDGVRPLIDDDLINKNISLTLEKGNAITVVPSIETTFESEDGVSIKNILDRSKLYLARAPQTFILKDIYNVHLMEIEKNNINNIDSCSMMHKYGANLNFVKGKSSNIKITNIEDYYIFKTLYELEKGGKV